MRPLQLYALAIAGLALAATGCDDNRPPGGARDAGTSADTGPDNADAGADNTYASCVTGTDCLDPIDQCLEVSIPAEGTYGAFCSYGCTADATCEARGGFDGACYSLDGTASICYPRCDFDTDCPSSSVCISVDLGGGANDFICVPNNG